eukprot:gene10489-7460_t
MIQGFSKHRLQIVDELATQKLKSNLANARTARTNELTEIGLQTQQAIVNGLLAKTLLRLMKSSGNKLYASLMVPSDALSFKMGRGTARDGDVTDHVRVIIAENSPQFCKERLAKAFDGLFVCKRMFSNRQQQKPRAWIDVRQRPLAKITINLQRLADKKVQEAVVANRMPNNTLSYSFYRTVLIQYVGPIEKAQRQVRRNPDGGIRFDDFYLHIGWEIIFRIGRRKARGQTSNEIS